MAQMGMDVEAVENIGRQLAQSASSVDQIVAGLDKAVGGLGGVWDGPDAQRFIQSWPTFRKSLVAAQASVAGLGKSALNNASEQRDASGTKGSGGLENQSPVSGSSSIPAAQPVASPRVISPDPQLQGWLDGVRGQHIDMDGMWGAQCVDLVNNYANQLFPGKPWWTTVGATDYARDMYANASPQYFDKLPADATPQPGDIICIGGVPGVSDLRQYGHVAIVESVDGAGVHVMQQDGNNSATGVAYEGAIPASQMAVLDGYLRAKSV